MRKVIVAAFVSLDGVMQAPGGPAEDPTGGFELGGWNHPYWDEEMGGFIGARFSQPFDLLLGRRTYEIFAAHWPHMPEGDPIAEVFNRATKHVATSRPERLDWANSTALEGDVAEAVRRLKATDGPDLLTQGSTVLVQSLFEHGLVDELSLMTFPVVLGRGKRLFGDRSLPTAWRAVETAVSTTGVTMALYQRDGEVKTGSFQLETPTAAELARRERLARGE